MKLDFIDTKYLYEHARLRNKVTGQPFDIWVDEFGKNRNVQHNDPRYKVTANGIEIDIILHKNDDIEFVNDSSEIRKFSFGKQAVKFIYKFKDVLRMQWNQEIDTYELGTIIRLVEIQGYDMNTAIDKVINGDF